MIVIPVMMWLFFHVLGHVWSDGTSAEFVARCAGSLVLTGMTVGLSALVTETLSELL